MDIKDLKTAKQLPAAVTKLITPEEIEDLSRNGMCPHYRLVNPLKDKVVYLYNPNEVHEWVNKELLKYFPYKFEPVLTIFQYNQTISAEDTQIPPPELAAVRNLLRLPISSTCMTPPGIYFLCREGKVVYVGQSVNVLGRVMTHVSEGQKEFESAFFIPVAEQHLDKIEQAFMKTFRPVYNLSNSGPTKDYHIEIVESLKIAQ